MENQRIINEEQFDAAMDSAQSVEDVLNIFHEMGADITEDDLGQFASQDINEELSEDALEGVAGGSWVMQGMLRCSQIMLRHAQQRLRMTLMRLNYRRYRW